MDIKYNHHTDRVIATMTPVEALALSAAFGRRSMYAPVSGLDIANTWRKFRHVLNQTPLYPNFDSADDSYGSRLYEAARAGWSKL